MKVLLNIIATNKYTLFLEDLILSSEQYFLPGIDKYYLIHTDHEIVPDDRLIINHIKHEPWPAPTLKRFEYFLQHKDLHQQMDYCFYIDVDSLFIDTITQTDVLFDLVGAIHPGFGCSDGTPERDVNSTAFIPPGANRYYCGGFFGGSSIEFLKLCSILHENINIDKKNNITAIWHDESHLNKYFYLNPPTKALPLGFAEDETINRPGARIHFLNKAVRFLGGHEYFRT